MFSFLESRRHLFLSSRDTGHLPFSIRGNSGLNAFGLAGPNKTYLGTRLCALSNAFNTLCPFPPRSVLSQTTCCVLCFLCSCSSSIPHLHFPRAIRWQLTYAKGEVSSPPEFLFSTALCFSFPANTCFSSSVHHFLPLSECRV